MAMTEKQKEWFRGYRKKNREKLDRVSRDWYLLNIYGITREKYNEMLAAQHESCFLCGIHQSKLKHALAVDHCHETGRIRGLLCQKCNIGLGNFNDDADLLLRAINYIKKVV